MALRRDEIDGRPVAEWDTETGLYRAWDADGVLTETRPLTDDEIADMTPPEPVETATLTVPVAALAEAADEASRATTVAGLRAALLKLLVALGGTE